VDSSAPTFRDGHTEGRIRWVSIFGFDSRIGSPGLLSGDPKLILFLGVIGSLCGRPVEPRYVCPTHIDAISSVLTKLTGGLDLIREYRNGQGANRHKLLISFA
jgi:hypothetical protein